MILFSTGSLYRMEMERIFRIAHDSGFKYLELMLRGKDEKTNSDTWSPNRLKELEEKYQIKITSVHSPIDFEFYPEEYLPKTIWLAKEISAQYLIIHLPKIKDKYKIYQEWFPKFKNKILDQPIPILIENMGKNELYSKAEQFNQFADFCFDITHAMEANIDPVATIKNMDNIRQFHLGYFDGQLDHLKPTLNKKLFRAILSLKPKANRCLEFKPHSFADSMSDEKIVEELKNEIKFLNLSNKLLIGHCLLP
jgi:sugar phosphate isomerase/epimerase